MIDAGLTVQWNQEQINPRGLIYKAEEIGPEVLTLEHLEIAFKIVMISISISFFVFIAEILIFHINKIFRKTKTS